jgi:hypothetical protein
MADLKQLKEKKKKKKLWPEIVTPAKWENIKACIKDRNQLSFT